VDSRDNWTSYLNQLYITPQDVAASKWLGVYRDNQAVVYGDLSSEYLSSYGLINPSNFSFLDPSIKNSIISANYFFFGSFNFAENTVAGWNAWNLSAFSFLQNDANEIYSNGGSEIYYEK
jgi:uncharacterized membrane protein